MDRYDILQAMSGIRDEYIEDAAVFPNQAIEDRDEKGLIQGAQENEIISGAKKTETAEMEISAEQAAAVTAEREISAKETAADEDTADQKKPDVREGDLSVENPGKKPGKKTGRAKILRLQRWAATAAALVCVCVVAFTIRSSQKVNSADSSDMSGTGMVSMSKEKVKVDDGIRTEDAQDAVSETETYASDDTKDAVASGAGDADGLVNEESAEAAADLYVEESDGPDVSAATAMTDAGVTGLVRQMTEEEVRVFENSLAEETGYSSLRFTHEVTTDSDDWFSLRMKAYTSAADGFEQVTHFNISRDTSEYVTLETLFSEGTDYITPLSKEVVRQMREQMASDPDAEFWLDSEEGPEYDFQEISPAQDFYFDENGNLVLCFNEGEAAPLYMGTVEFTIPRDITEKLLKNRI